MVEGKLGDFSPLDLFELFGVQVGAQEVWAESEGDSQFPGGCFQNDKLRRKDRSPVE